MSSDLEIKVKKCFIYSLLKENYFVQDLQRLWRWQEWRTDYWGVSKDPQEAGQYLYQRLDRGCFRVHWHRSLQNNRVRGTQLLLLQGQRAVGTARTSPRLLYKERTEEMLIMCWSYILIFIVRLTLVDISDKGLYFPGSDALLVFACIRGFTKYLVEHQAVLIQAFFHKFLI